ncbi:MAG: hypothetical protein ACKVQA_03175 [Burkholderiales bacterium]
MKFGSHVRSFALVFATMNMLIGIGSWQTVLAYEVVTHAAITQKAWARALAEDSALLDRLDLRDDTDAFQITTEDYHDAGGDGARLRAISSAYEGNKIEKVSGQPKSIGGWLMRGAIREDDDSTECCDPKDDSFGNFHRVFSHFFDPVNDLGLTVGGVTAGPSARRWALDSTATSNYLPLLDNPTRHNHFNLETVREALHIGLTGYDSQGNVKAGDSLARRRYLATAFRALGNVLHLNQDMAQPQHTRNDPHSGKVPIIAGHKSAYERYTDARVTGENTAVVRDGIPLDVQALPVFYDGYPTPKLKMFADYWATGDLKGLANYSNRGFFSAGTLPGSNGYASPSNDITIYSSVISPTEKWDGTATPEGSPPMELLFGPVNDALFPERSFPGVPLLARSMWDEFIQEVPIGVWSEYGTGYAPTLMLTRANYDTMADLLIPRAVAYSAGLIQHFFRGRMEISLPDEGVYGIIDHAPSSNGFPNGFSKIKMKLKMKLKNTTPRSGSAAGDAIEPMGGSGMLLLVAKYHNNTCYQPDLSGEYGSPGIDWRTCRSEEESIAVSDLVPVPLGINGEAQQMTFTFPAPIPISATDLKLQVVYRGPLGEDTQAIVVATKDISEPHYIYNYRRWDQYTYSFHWPVLNGIGGPLSYAQWCTGGTPPGFPSVTACNEAEGHTVKMAYSSTSSPVPGYDPANPPIPQDTYRDLSLEPPLSPVAVMRAPIGTLTRIAVLTDAIPANPAVWVEERIDVTHGVSTFMWITGIAATTTNQMDLKTKNLVPSVTYLPGRGVYLPSGENTVLTSGTANPMPNLTLVPSEIKF